MGFERLKEMTDFSSPPSSNKIFGYALGLSLFIHIGALVQFAYHHPGYYKEKPVPKLELVYQPVKAVNLKRDRVKRVLKEDSSNKLTKEIKLTQERRISPNNKMFFNNQLGISPFIKDMDNLSGKILLNKNQMASMDSRNVARRITVPAIKSEKISNPVYLNYDQIIRNKIKDRAYMNYSGIDIGEVYLTFVLASDGSLKQIKLIEEKTSANEYLKNIGLKSIQESTPFPSFPRDLKYPELSFNVLIKFEIKD